MSVPEGDAVLTAAWLSRALKTSRHWSHGSVQTVSATRIGAGHGWGGRLHRVIVETETGRSVSFVVKEESAGAVERELLVRHECGERLEGLIPGLLGGVSDDDSGRGVLLLEDVAPVEQGDVLHGCTWKQADAVVRVLARLHGTSWKARDDALPANLPDWGARPMEPERWIDRLTRASERFPEILTETRVHRLRDLPADVALAVDRLCNGPKSWIHGDAHLDNVVWRPDGTAVLLDWCNAAIGPPAADLARFLGEGVEAGSRPALVAAYLQELEAEGVTPAEYADIAAAVEFARLPFLQGMVGWAGRERLSLQGRSAAVCESGLRGICAWVLAGDDGSQVGRSGV